MEWGRGVASVYFSFTVRLLYFLYLILSNVME
jgi:hypothetical protein